MDYESSKVSLYLMLKDFGLQHARTLGTTEGFEQAYDTMG